MPIRTWSTLALSLTATWTTRPTWGLADAAFAPGRTIPIGTAARAARATLTAGSTRSAFAAPLVAALRPVAGMTTTRTTAARAPRTAGTRTARTASASGFVAVRLARATRAIGIAMAARAGFHAFRYVPGPERARIAGARAGLLVAARAVQSRCPRALRRKWLVRLLGRGFAADREPAVLARAAAATTAVFADIVEAAQFAAFVGAGDVAAEIGVA